MILRIFIFLGIIGYFVWDYTLDSKRFKRLVFPIIGISFLASSDFYVGLDDRIKLITVVILALFTIRYSLAYYNDYKKERFREKRRIRDIRDRERIERDTLLLKEILDVKNQDIREKSSSYEITMDLPRTSSQSASQIDFLGIEDKSFEENPFEDESWKVETPKAQILENQIGMFEDK